MHPAVGSKFEVVAHTRVRDCQDIPFPSPDPSPRLHNSNTCIDESVRTRSVAMSGRHRARPVPDPCQRKLWNLRHRLE